MRSAAPWWFLLNRFDGDAGDGGTGGDGGAGDGAGDAGADGGDGGTGGSATDPKEKDAEYWKARARQNEARAKENAEKAKKFDDAEAARLSTEERLAKEKADADNRANAATARAVRAEVRALADEFADRDDAVLNLGDLTRFVDAAGEVDTDAISKELTAVLERKTHLRKPAAGAGGKKPDPGQGGGRGETAPTDFRAADKAAFAAEAAKYGLRTRSTT